VKFAVPTVVGIPVMTPPVDRARPAGSVPAVTDHVYCGVPPVAAKVCEYAVPTVPLTSGDAVVIESGGGSIVRANCPVTVRDALSRT